MTQKEKELLLKDLCGRLPYDPIVYVDENLPRLKLGAATRVWEYVAVDKPCKPYLRPLSSMTKEERMELECLSAEYFGKALDKQIQESLSSSNRNESRILEYIASSVIIDWLNAHHFDYRGLIEKGLAIEAPEGMYN